MAFTITYKRLFELHIHHGFFLNQGVDDFYDLSASKREKILENYNLQKEIEITPTKECKRLLERLQMKYTTLARGLIVGLEVEEPTSDNPNQYLPRIPVDTGTAFTFRIKLKNSMLASVSSSRMRPNIPGILYFSNFRDIEEMTFPSLALSPAAYLPTRSYEAGELVKVADKIYESVKTVPLNTTPPTDPPADVFWQEIPDKQYLSYRNRMLVPSKFEYTFTTNPGESITEGTISLSNDELEDPIEIPFSFEEPVSSMLVDLEKEEVESGFYDFQISTTDNSYIDSHKIYLNDDLYDRGAFAIVEIAHEPELEDFRLFEPSGILRLNDDQSDTEHPGFQIRIRNRSTVWKYLLHPSQNPADIPDTSAINDPDQEFVKKMEENGNTYLVSKVPKPLTTSLVSIKLTDDIKLPNPANLMVKPDRSEGTLFSEIYLSKIQL